MAESSYNRWKRWGVAVGFGFLIVLSLFYVDYEDSDYPELRKAVRVVRHTSARNELRRSSFMVIKGDKTPSQFVSWMFSPMGTAEWYMPEDSMEFTAEEMKMVGRVAPLVPKDVAIVPDQAGAELGKQVVVISDDARKMIVVEAYLNPNKPPVFIKEWKFPEFKS